MYAYIELLDIAANCNMIIVIMYLIFMYVKDC